MGSGSRRNTSSSRGSRGLGLVYIRDLELELTAPPAHLRLCKLTATLLAPPFTNAEHDREDQFHHASFIPQMRNDLGASALFCKRPLGQIGRADSLLMPLGDVELIETGLG